MQRSSVEDVIVLFREKLPANSSKFEVSVPHRFLAGRRFRFERLMIVPGLVNTEAAQLKVEADIEGLVFIKSTLRLEIKFVGDKKNFFPSKFLLGALARSSFTRDFVVEFNNFFELEKPAFMKRCPVFFDWTDIRMSAEDDHMRHAELFQDVWFNEPFDKGKHDGGLPASLRNLPGVNQLKFPKEGFSNSEMTQENFRVRLFLAPYTTVGFSSFGILQDLGFTPDQFGEQTTKVKYSLANQTAHFTEITAFSAPVFKLTATSCTVSLIPSDTVGSSYNRSFEISTDNYKKHEVLAQVINDKIQDCADQINIELSLEYDSNAKKFKFNFPSTTEIFVSVIFQRPELPMRMGFLYNNIITNADDPKAMEETCAAPNVDDAHKRCVSLCYDTGIVVCTLDQASSNATSGAMDFYMASLLPSMAGVMELDRSCLEMYPGVLLVSQSGATMSSVPISFELLRIYDNQEMRKFAWKDEAYVNGILRGVTVVDGAPKRHLPSARYESLV